MKDKCKQVSTIQCLGHLADKYSALGEKWGSGAEKEAVDSWAGRGFLGGARVELSLGGEAAVWMEGKGREDIQEVEKCRQRHRVGYVACGQDP